MAVFEAAYHPLVSSAPAAPGLPNEYASCSDEPAPALKTDDDIGIDELK